MIPSGVTQSSFLLMSKIMHLLSSKLWFVWISKVNWLMLSHRVKHTLSLSCWLPVITNLTIVECSSNRKPRGLKHNQTTCFGIAQTGVISKSDTFHGLISVQHSESVACSCQECSQRYFYMSSLRWGHFHSPFGWDTYKHCLTRGDRVPPFAQSAFRRWPVGDRSAR